MPVNTQSYPGLTGLTRRQCLLAAAGLAGWTAPSLAFSASGTGTTLAAAWEADNRYQIGLIAVNEQGFSIQHATPVPTRPHALLVEAGGSLLAVARRPGDWLVRWRPGQPEQKPQWHWIDGDRRFNGHAVPSADGGMLWTTETDLETAEGRLGVRTPASLEKIDEWTTHGMDPHELLVLPQRVGAFPAGTLVVANGGIATLPETGRTKRDTARMDASLVALHPRTGARLGQWRLADPYLSVRHLAWDARNQRLGIALQAEHPSPDDRWRAPVLAIWDGECLAASPKAPDLRGYGGAVAALPEGGFLVGCPRANVVAAFDGQGRWSHNLSLAEACAVAVGPSQWWAGGSTGVLHANNPSHSSPNLAAAKTIPRWDNHWQVWPFG
jgi:uncharacterized protein